MNNIMLDKADSITHDLVVVAFDMCSSLKLIEDLTRTENLSAYDKLLKNLHLWLWSNAKTSDYVVYQFTGDGWILLFPTSSVDGNSLMNFIVKLSIKHNDLRETHVDRHLESMPSSTGLTFGVEMGPLHKIILGNKVEFVGRAINVACRLQSTVKDKGLKHDYACLFSRKVYNSLLKDVVGFKFIDVERSLRNISGGEKYRCVKTNLSRRVHNT